MNLVPFSVGPLFENFTISLADGNRCKLPDLSLTCPLRARAHLILLQVTNRQKSPCNRHAVNTFYHAELRRSALHTSRQHNVIIRREARQSWVHVWPMKVEMPGKAQRVARSAQTCLQNSGATGPKFTNILADVEESSAVLTRASTLLYSHPLWNASAQHEGELCQFSSISAEIGDQSNVLWAIAKRRSDWHAPAPIMCTYPENLLKTGSVLSEIITGLQRDR